LVRLRLQRHGRKKAAYYHIVAADSRKKRDGRIIEDLGRFNPLTEPVLVKVDTDRVIYWLKTGAQPSETVERILRKEGIYYRMHLERWKKSPEEIEETISKWKEERENKTDKVLTGKEAKKAALAAEKEAFEKEQKRLAEEAAKKAEEERAAREKAEAEAKAAAEAEAKAAEKEKAEAKADDKSDDKAETAKEEKADADAEAKADDKEKEAAEAKPEKEEKKAAKAEAEDGESEKKS